MPSLCLLPSTVSEKGPVRRLTDKALFSESNGYCLMI